MPEHTKTFDPFINRNYKSPVITHTHTYTHMMTLTHVYLVSSATLYGLCTLVWSAHPARNSSPSLRRLTPTLGFRSEFVPIMPRSAIIIITSTSPSLCWRLISMWLQIKPIDTVSVDVPLVVKICKHFVIKISISFASSQLLPDVRTGVWHN